MKWTGVLLVAVLAAGCGTGNEQTRSPTTSVPGESPAVYEPGTVEAHEVYVLNADTRDVAQPGIIEGMVSVRFVTDARGNVVRLPSGRPLIMHEDVMRDIARANLQQNYARYMEGTVVEGVSMATAEYLRNYLNEPEVVAYQQNIYRVAFKQRLPALREREWVLQGNLLTVRADVRPQAREVAESASLEALQAAVRTGRVDRDDATAFIERTLREMGLQP